MNEIEVYADDEWQKYPPASKGIYVITDGTTDYPLSGSAVQGSNYIGFSAGAGGEAIPGYVNNFILPVGKYKMFVKYNMENTSGYTPSGIITLPANVSPASVTLSHSGGYNTLTFNISVTDATNGSLKISDTGYGELRIYDLNFLKQAEI